MRSLGEEVKTGSRLKIALIVVSTFFVISLIANLYLYTRQYGGITPDSGLENQVTNLQTELDSLNTTYQNYVSTHNQLQTWLDGNKTLLQTTIDERDQLEEWLGGNITDYESEIDRLDSQINSLDTQVTNLQNQINTLQSTIDALKAPKLIHVNIIGTNNRPLFQTPYLEITGEVVNVGTNTAYNSKIHVVLYQGEVVAEDTYINLGTIVGEGYETVDSKIYYTGETLTGWSMTTEWD